MVFIKNEAALLCVTMWERARAFAATVQCKNFLIQLFSLKGLVFVVHFLHASCHGNDTFPKGSSQNEIVSLLVVFHLPYSKYKRVKICFYSCCYQIRIFHSCRTRVVRVALVLHLRPQCSTRVALVSHSCHSCLTCVSLVLLVLHSCCISVVHVALVSLVSGTGVVNQTRSKNVTQL